MARVRASWPAALGVFAALSGCSSESDSSRPTTALTARDFAAPVASAPVPERPAPAPPVPTERRGEVEATGGIDDVHALVGSPVVAPPPAPAQPPTGAVAEGAAPVPPPASAQPGGVGAPLAPGASLVDSLVGQINGRPVFSADFFAPMDARLRAEARTARSREEWFGSARQQIRAALIDKMRDELLLAEFEAALSPEQRMGVLAFVEDLRGNLTSLAEGSQELANKRLLETEGVTLEQKVKLERDQELIRAQVGKALGDRSYVAWREVVQAYERDYDKYHPAPIARLRVIQAPLSDEARVARVAAAIEAGENWADIATRESASNATEGGLREITLEPDGYAKTTFYSGEELNKAAQGLTVGASATLDFAGSRFWMRLEEIDQRPSQSLYDVQKPILERLYAVRMGEEEGKYFNQLLDKASASDLNQMATRLERLAVERYAPLLVSVPARAGARPPTAAPAPPPAAPTPPGF